MDEDIIAMKHIFKLYKNVSHILYPQQYHYYLGVITVIQTQKRRLFIDGLWPGKALNVPKSLV